MSVFKVVMNSSIKNIILIMAIVAAAGGLFPVWTQQNAGYIFIPDNGNFIVWNFGGTESIIHMSKLTKWKLDADMAAVASGKRVMTAKDDAAVLAVASRMESVMQGLLKEARNAEDMKNYFQYVDSVLEQNSALLQRIQILVQGATGVIMGPDERAMNQEEIAQLLRQIDMNAEFSQFNTRQVIPFLTAQYLGLEGVDVVKNPYGAFQKVESAMKTIRFLRTSAGVKSNVLSFQIQGKTLYALSMAQTVSTMVDADLGERIAEIIRGGVSLKIQYGILLKGK